jgi:hypothetical protein
MMPTAPSMRMAALSRQSMSRPQQDRTKPMGIKAAGGTHDDYTGLNAETLDIAIPLADWSQIGHGRPLRSATVAAASACIRQSRVSTCRA